MRDRRSTLKYIQTQDIECRWRRLRPNTMARKPGMKKALFEEAVASVECSAMANNFGESTIESYRSTAEFAAVDWLNERKIDNFYASKIVAEVMKRAGLQ